MESIVLTVISSMCIFNLQFSRAVPC